MLLKLKACDLIEALDVVSVVQPASLTGQSSTISAALLFKCHRSPDGSPRCSIYSRGDHQVARAEFGLLELDGEGAFTIPAHHIDMWRKVPDDAVTFESVKEEGQAFMMKAWSTRGVTYQHSTYDPQLIKTCDKDFEAAEAAAKDIPTERYTWVPGVLREALLMAEPFLPARDKKDDVDAHLNTVQIFDESNADCAKGDGHMYCLDGTRSFYFQTPDFQGKGLAVHSRFLGKLAEFLGKCSGPVRLLRSPNMTYAANEKGQIFGWVHATKAHSRFLYLLASRDKFVLIVPKPTILSAIVVAETMVTADRVRLVYQHNNPQTGGPTLQLAASGSSGKIESFPVAVFAKDSEPSLEEDFACLVHLGHFKSLIADAKGNAVELRFAPKPPPGRGGILRTTDVFQLRASGKLVSVSEKPEPGDTVRETPHTCTVTRCMSTLA